MMIEIEISVHYTKKALRFSKLQNVNVISQQNQEQYIDFKIATKLVMDPKTEMTSSSRSRRVLSPPQTHRK